MLQEAREEGAGLNTEVDHLAGKVEKVESRFREEGGELFLDRAELEAERKRLKAELTQEEEALRDIAAGAAPLLLIPSLLDQTETLAREESEVRKAHVLATVLGDRDAEVIEQLKKQKLPGKHLAAVEALLAADRERRQETKAEIVLADANDHLAAELRHLRTTVLPEARKNIEQRLEAIASLQERITRMDMELARVPTEEAIIGLQRELEQARQRWQERSVVQAAQEDKMRLLDERETPRLCRGGSQRLTVPGIHQRRGMGSSIGIRSGEQRLALGNGVSPKVRPFLLWRSIMLLRAAPRLEGASANACSTSVRTDRAALSRSTSDKPPALPEVADMSGRPPGFAGEAPSV